VRSLAEVLKRLGKLRGKRRLKIDVHAWLPIEHEQGLLVFIIFENKKTLMQKKMQRMLRGRSWTAR